MWFLKLSRYGCVVAGEKEESHGRRSLSSSARKDQVRQYVISSSSSSSSRSRSSSRSSGRSRSSRRHCSHRRKHSRKHYHSGSRHRSRSRTRSHSHGPSSSGQQSYEKKPVYFGTNSSDPKMVASRLFVGNLPYDITKDDIRGIYSKYGNIIGNKNYVLFVVTTYSYHSAVYKNDFF